MSNLRVRRSHYMWEVIERTTDKSAEVVRGTFGCLYDANSLVLGLEERMRRATKTCAEFTWGFKFGKHSTWVGAHYSEYNRRLCVNLLPCCTLWFVWPGGMRP